MRTEIVVTGMTCEHCERAVGDALRTVDDVTSVTVRADEGLATIEHDNPLDTHAVEAAVIEAGYSVEA